MSHLTIGLCPPLRGVLLHPLPLAAAAAAAAAQVLLLRCQVRGGARPARSTMVGSAQWIGVQDGEHAQKQSFTQEPTKGCGRAHLALGPYFRRGCGLGPHSIQICSRAAARPGGLQHTGQAGCSTQAPGMGMQPGSSQIIVVGASCMQCAQCGYAGDERAAAALALGWDWRLAMDQWGGRGHF